ncbi:MAG: glycosyltransferase family 4 protein [Bryobacteraceae bacterium]
MRILHIDTGTEMRGGQHQVLLLLKTLQTMGCEQSLLVRHSGPLAEMVQSAGFPVHVGGLTATWRLSRSFDIVHAHDARAHLLAAASAARFVVSRRVAFPVKRTPASRCKYARAARYLAVSHHVARELESAGIPQAKIDIVYDSVETQESIPAWDPTAPAVALASTDPMKGRDLVERAAHVSGVPVVFSDDLALDLRHASLFAYITRSEGLGSAALLAMSLGVPVVASAVGGLPEIVEHQQTGLLTGNEEGSIARAMRRILEEPDLALRLRTSAFAAVKERFSPEHMAQDTLASYRRAIGS